MVFVQNVELFQYGNVYSTRDPIRFPVLAQKKRKCCKGLGLTFQQSHPRGNLSGKLSAAKPKPHDLHEPNAQLNAVHHEKGM